MNQIQDYLVMCERGNFQECAGIMENQARLFQTASNQLIERVLPLDIKIFTMVFLNIVKNLDPEQYRLVYENFLRNFDPKQIILTGGAFSKLVDKYTEFMIFKLKSPIKAIKPLKEAISIIQKCNEVDIGLTRLHTKLLEVSIHARFYQAALQLIRQPMLQLSDVAHFIEDSDVYLYFYYSGIVRVAYRLFNEAQLDFRRAVEFCHELSEIKLDAKQKLILLELRDSTQCEHLRENQSNSFEQKLLNLLIQPYIGIGEALRKQQLDEHMAKYEELYKDHNFPLVKKTFNGGIIEQLKQLKVIYVRYQYDEFERENQLKQDIVEFVVNIHKSQNMVQVDRQNNALTFTSPTQLNYLQDVIAPLEGKLQRLKAIRKVYGQTHNELIKIATNNKNATGNN